MIPNFLSSDYHDITGRGRVYMVRLDDSERQELPSWATKGAVVCFNGQVQRVTCVECSVGMDGKYAPQIGLGVAPLSFVSEGTHSIAVHGTKLTVYSVRNPVDVFSREALDYLKGQTVLIDGTERRVHSVESFCIGGAYPAGKWIGLAVKGAT